MTIGMLNKIGAKRLSLLGALLQKWENTGGEGVSFTEWILDTTFVDSMKHFAEATKQTCKQMSENTRYLKKELELTNSELSESKKDIARLVSVNKDLYQKIEELHHPSKYSIDSVRNILITFNKENPIAVANGGGVVFEEHVKINSVETLGVFLSSEHARKLGVPSNILVTFKVFVLDGKLVTLSDEYHDGVGYSFLWKKKKKTRGVVGWSSVLAKQCDPRLGIDPVTGVNYIDPETGKMWIHPVLAEQSSEPTKRALSETSESSSESSSVTKKLKSDGGSSVSGSEENELGVKEEEHEKISGVKEEEQEKDSGVKEDGEVVI